MAEPVSSAEFWKLLLKSRLLEPEDASTLRRELEQHTPQADAVVTATWLGKRGRITSWQARQLLKGRSGPFYLGDYLLLEQRKTPYRGRVFSARHHASGRDVTLVVLETEACDDSATWEAVVQATQQATAISDPVVSQTWALEQAGRRRMIVCEAVEGTPLSERFADVGPRGLADVGEMVFAVTRAVAELHRHGIVHGAISLHTILEPAAPNTAANDAPPVRLLQFPLAGEPHVHPPRLPLDNQRQLEALGQRVCFVAPELATPGCPATATSDVYSLGCVLAALLTGSLPNWDGTVSGTLARAQQQGFPSTTTAGLPTEVAAAIAYMTASDPLERYPSAVDAAAAVAACCGFPEFPLDPPATAPVATEASTPQVSTEPSAPSAASRRRRRTAAARSRRFQTIGLGLLAVAVAIAGGVWLISRPGGEEPVVVAPPTPVDKDKNAEVPAPPDAPKDEVAGRPQQLLDDDSLPWASPTTGLPPSLAYLPPGSQLILLARPAALLADEEGQRFVQALGPRVEELFTEAEDLTGISRTQFEELRIGWSTTAAGAATAGFVLVCEQPLDTSAATARWSQGSSREQDGETVYEAGDVQYWQPTSADGRVLVAGSAAAINDSIAADGLPLIPPDVEELLAALDGQRHLTLLGSPSFLRNDGRLFLPEPLLPPALSIAELLGDRSTVAALSLFLGKTCYAEIDLVPTTAAPPRQLAADLAQALGGLADDVEQRCLSLAANGYGGRLIGRLPGMLRVVAAEMRAGDEDGLAVVNVHLPREAAHNITLAAELALSQERQGPAVAVAPTQPAEPETIPEKLRQQMSLVFAKDTLEKSIELLSGESGIPMEILGGDLQLEGITKNQSFGLDQTDQTVDAILRVILEKANPDGKLVYVIRGEGADASLVITTRAAASKRGESLPPGFETP